MKTQVNWTLVIRITEHNEGTLANVTLWDTADIHNRAFGPRCGRADAVNQTQDELIDTATWCLDEMGISMDDVQIIVEDMHINWLRGNDVTDRILACSGIESVRAALNEGLYIEIVRNDHEATGAMVHHDELDLHLWLELARDETMEATGLLIASF